MRSYERDHPLIIHGYSNIHTCYLDIVKYCGEKKMKLITCHLPEAYIEGLDRLISQDSYPNRSEAIRVAVRDLLKSELGGFVKLSPKEAPADLLME